MDRRAAAQAFSTAAAFPLALLAESEAELSSAREEVTQLRAALAQRDASIGQMQAAMGDRCKQLFDDLADYERTVAGLREKLREEEARRASYQAVDAAARRFVAEALVNTIEETRSNPDLPCVRWRCVRLNTGAEPWETLRDACARA